LTMTKAVAVFAPTIGANINGILFDKSIF